MLGEPAMTSKSPTLQPAKQTRFLAHSAFAIFRTAAGLLAAAFACHSQTVYVSGLGSDTNPCTISQPCREISKGLAVVASGGEVVVSGSGIFQPFQITRPVTVSVARNSDAAVISQGAGSAVVVGPIASGTAVLSGLIINAYNGLPAIEINQGAGSVIVRRCRLRGAAVGIVNRGSAVTISDTEFLGFFSAAIADYNNGPGALTITNTIVQFAITGVSVVNGGRVAIRDSIFIGTNATSQGANPPPSTSLYGINAAAPSSGSTASNVTVDHCVITGYQQAVSGQNILVSNSTIAFDAMGVQGNILTRGNNLFYGNGNDGAFSGTVAAK
jgi:hypothetical protein